MTSLPIFELYRGKRWSEECVFVKIYVEYNKQRIQLIDLLKIWETPFVVPPQLPGHYHWNTAFAIYRELVVCPEIMIDSSIRGDYRTVLVCDCLNEGCWPFCVIAKETKNQVMWTKYLQPHRNKKSFAGFWDYSKYPPLVFDKQQYYDELQPLKPIYEEWAKRQAEWEASHPPMTAAEACKLSKSEILVTLRSRFSEIPKEIETAIDNITSPGILDLGLLPRAKTCLSLDEFAERLKYYTDSENTSSEINTTKRIGFARGIAKGKTVANLREKFSEIPEEIVRAIFKISDVDILNLLVTHSQTCRSLDEFAEKLSKISEKIVT
jgi:hypothetical protein